MPCTASSVTPIGPTGTWAISRPSSLARASMAENDVWQDRGFDEIAKNYLARLAPPAEGKESGVRRELAGVRVVSDEDIFQAGGGDVGYSLGVAHH